jgi:DMSO/TMAO reductase YedYZ molybdopterin-dependent catalytic subunit
VTPTSRYFVRNHFATPTIDHEHWRLSVEGDVERPFIMTYDELRALPRQRLLAVLESAGNSRASVHPRPEGVLWRNGAVGSARWSGVPLPHLLDRTACVREPSRSCFRVSTTGRSPA